MSLTFTDNLNFNKDGKYISAIKIPHSTNASGWGSLLLPVIVIRNGDGPTILFTGGNHGDEYEGPIALRKLANEIKGEDIQGQIIIVPYLNYPAVLAGTRLSPVDGQNMNRSFPGNPDGSITEDMADPPVDRAGDARNLIESNSNKINNNILSLNGDSYIIMTCNLFNNTTAFSSSPILHVPAG